MSRTLNDAWWSPKMAVLSMERVCAVNHRVVEIHSKDV